MRLAEQAVSYAALGPLRPRAYDKRPDATDRTLPVAANTLDRLEKCGLQLLKIVGCFKIHSCQAPSERESALKMIGM